MFLVPNHAFPFVESCIRRGSHQIYINYPDMKVNIRYLVPLVDFDVFTRAARDGLGLFLGFSIIDTLLYLYNFIFRIHKQR